MTITTESDYCLDYVLFVYNEAYEQEKFNRSLYGILGESVEVLNERSIGEVLKGLIDKIVTGIKNAWARFIKWAGDISTNNNKYLEKHKEVILNKKPLKATISSFNDYDITAIRTAKVPTYDEIKLQNAPSEKEDFISKFPELSKYYKDKEKSFSDNVKYFLRSSKEPHDVQATSLDMQKLYDYVYNYNTNIKNDIQNDINKLEEANKKSQFTIKKLMKRDSAKVTVKRTVNKTETTTDNKTAETSTTNTASSNNGNEQTNNEAFSFEKTLSYYFNEDGEGMNIKDAPDQEKVEKTDGGASTDTEAGKDKQLESAVKMYFTLCAELLGARLNTAQEAYKNYMRIIKWHVKKYVKDDEVPAQQPKETENKEENKTEEEKK